jgi:hypothetical protein
MKAGCYQVAAGLLGVFPPLNGRTAGSPQGRCEIANEHQSLPVLMGHVSVLGVASGYPLVYDEHAYPFVPSMNLVTALLEYTRTHYTKEWRSLIWLIAMRCLTSQSYMRSCMLNQGAASYR